MEEVVVGAAEPMLAVAEDTAAVVVGTTRIETCRRKSE
jgi:hypothetical protein